MRKLFISFYPLLREPLWSLLLRALERAAQEQASNKGAMRGPSQ